MRNHHLAWSICVIGGLVMTMPPDLAGAANCGDAIDRAITEWREKEPTWAYPEAKRERGPGRCHAGFLDERTRIAFGRPIAKTLANVCGQSGVKTLQTRVDEAPRLVLLTLDELGAADAVAECAVKSVLGREAHSTEKPYLEVLSFPGNVLIWVSMCSPASRHATATALARPPLAAQFSRELILFYTNTAFSFIAAAGDRGTLHALESVAGGASLVPKDTKKIDLRPYYSEAATVIRSREALPLNIRDTHERDDLLFWQANVDMLNYHAASMSYEQSAQTLANQHEKISTDYLLEKLRQAVEEIARENCDRKHRLPHPPRLNVSPVGLVLCILEKQRDPAAIPALKEFAKKNPGLAEDVRKAIEAIQGTITKPDDETGVPGASRTVELKAIVVRDRQPKNTPTPKP